jgi:hypothetical protein
MSMLGGKLKIFLIVSGALLWLTILGVVLRVAYLTIARAVSVTRWHWRCSKDLKPRSRDILGAFLGYLKDIAMDGPPDLSIGRSYWRDRDEWKIDHSITKPKG